MTTTKSYTPRLRASTLFLPPWTKAKVNGTGHCPMAWQIPLARPARWIFRGAGMEPVMNFRPALLKSPASSLFLRKVPLFPWISSSAAPESCKVASAFWITPREQSKIPQYSSMVGRRSPASVPRSPRAIPVVTSQFLLYLGLSIDPPVLIYLILYLF